MSDDLKPGEVPESQKIVDSYENSQEQSSDKSDTSEKLFQHNTFLRFATYRRYRMPKKWRLPFSITLLVLVLGINFYFISIPVFIIGALFFGLLSSIIFRNYSEEKRLKYMFFISVILFLGIFSYQYLFDVNILDIYYNEQTNTFEATPQIRFVIENKSSSIIEVSSEQLNSFQSFFKDGNACFIPIYEGEYMDAVTYLENIYSTLGGDYSTKFLAAPLPDAKGLISITSIKDGISFVDYCMNIDSYFESEEELFCRFVSRDENTILYSSYFKYSDNVLKAKYLGTC